MAMLDPFYPIVEDAGWVARLTRLGVKLVQLRIKERSAVEIRAEVRKARALCAAHRTRLVVNDYWEIATEEGCDFVHLGQEDLDGADLAAIRRAGLRVGVSTHDHAELDRALSISPNYVALGPIYPTRLKAMRFAPQGLERIGEWKRLVGKIPLVAIGGITAERAPAVLRAGADVVSVVTDITLNPDPEVRVQEWLAVTRAPA